MAQRHAQPIGGCRLLIAGALIATAAAAPLAAQPDDPWTFEPDLPLASRWPRGAGFGTDTVRADLYRPRGADRVPAAVIVSSSGGVSAQVEHHYARALVREGMAALVIDSFVPRGVRRTADDQTRVPQERSNADAFAGLRWLAEKPWVDPGRVVVLGMSRGGEAAFTAAIDGARRQLGAADARFAAHVAITPGGCNLPRREVRTSGAPVFFMLAELDDVHAVATCMDLVLRMRAAGRSAVRVAVYPGVHHGFEGTAGIAHAPHDWNSHDCAGRYWREHDGRLVERANGRPVTGDVTRMLLDTCIRRGLRAGGDARVKAQATADLLQFLRDADVLRDPQARAVVPDCSALQPPIVRENCERARAGWPGDLVALARALRARAEGADPASIARMLELAAHRGDSDAQWELAVMTRHGQGTGRDGARAIALARAAAHAGNATAMNVYGVMLRDGVGGPPAEAEALAWFRRAAALRSGAALANVGRMQWDGRGGLAVDRVAAVATWRRALEIDDSPWAAVLLADALAAGDGVPRDTGQALRWYRSAADQERVPEARDRARAALAARGEIPR